METGRTECVKDTVNPEWATKFLVDYSFEERQPIRLDVYDWDVKRGRLEEQDFLGRVEATMGMVVSARPRFQVRKIKSFLVSTYYFYTRLQSN